MGAASYKGDKSFNFQSILNKFKFLTCAYVL